MSSVLGHAEVISRIERERPAVSLLLGPSSVGKWTAAEYLRSAWGVHEDDTVRITRLTVDAARQILEAVSTTAIHDRKLVVVRLGGSTTQSRNLLLKTLEEGTTSADFILISSEAPPPVIATRASMYRFGLLAELDVARILTRRRFKADDAKHYASMAGGQVARALAVAGSPDLREQVILAARAIQDADAPSLEAASKVWTHDHTGLLAQWCRESMTGRARIFSAEEAASSSRVAYQILQALTTTVRPKLLVRSALMSVLRGA